MARPLRINIEDGWYHVCGRGIDRRSIYLEDRERIHFLDLLEAAVERHRIIIHAYSLMTNHYHLIVQTPDANLSVAMQWLSTSYSMWFNLRNQRVGPLFQGRFKSIPIENSAWAYEASLYVHLNPVMRSEFDLNPWSKKAESKGWKEPTPEQVKRRLAELRRYEWSSYRTYASYREGPKWLTTNELLCRAARKKDQRVREYRKDVKHRLTKGVTEPFQERLKSGIALGAEKFLKQVKNMAKGCDRETKGKQELRRRVEFKDVVKAVEEIKGEKYRDFDGRRGDWGKPLVLLMARLYCGMTLKEIGAAVGGMDYAAAGIKIKRFQEKVENMRDLAIITNKVKTKVLNVET
ncbi:transposase [Verrucomicrobiota bacterium]